MIRLIMNHTMAIIAMLVLQMTSFGFSVIREALLLR